MVEELIRIAIVDDDESYMYLYAEYLSRRGFRNISTHSSGKEFIDFYQSNSCPPPDIVLLDIEMDEMNGFQVLEQALQSSAFPRTLFVSHSAYLNLEDSPWLGYLGFDYNLPKLSGPEELPETLRSLSANKDMILSKRNPYGNLVAAIHDLSRMRLRSAVLENVYIKKLISPEVFSLLDSSPEKVVPKNQDVAIGFVDIRGFTQLMNRLQIQQVNEVLKLFFNNTIECLIEEGGYVDKFIGDEVMWFHLSNSVAESCSHCVTAAVRIIRSLKELNKAIQSRLHLRLKVQVGIGIACGTAAVGIFGAPNYRIQYSVLGPPVNLAARLCSEARAGEVLIGGEAIEYCPFKTRKIGFRAIKGFDHDVELRKLSNPQRIIL